MTSRTKCGFGGNKSVEFLFAIKVNVFQLKINCYNYKMFYVNSVVTTKKIPIDGIHKKMRKESVFHYKNINKTQRKTLREEVKDKRATGQTENNEQNGNSKSFPISH